MRRLFLSLFLIRSVMYSAIVIPESVSSFDVTQVQTRCVHDFQSDNVAQQIVCDMNSSVRGNKSEQRITEITARTSHEVSRWL
jgi:hypothetical protein